jgi:hypothetical protein
VLLLDVLSNGAYALCCSNRCVWSTGGRAATGYVRSIRSFAAPRCVWSTGSCAYASSALSAGPCAAPGCVCLHQPLLLLGGL